MFNNVIEDYSQKWKIQKQKINQGNKEKLQERSREYYRNLSENEKIKTRNYANNRNKNMSDEDIERKKEYMRSYYHKRN